MFLDHEAIAIVALYTGLNTLLMMVLSYLAVLKRRQHSVPIGHGDVVEVLRAQRAFGNAAEHVPAGLLLLIALAGLEAQPTWLHLTGGLLTAGRFLHGVGLSRTAENSPPRTLGALFTWAAYLAGGGLALALAFGVRLAG